MLPPALCELVDGTDHRPVTASLTGRVSLSPRVRQALIDTPRQFFTPAHVARMQARAAEDLRKLIADKLVASGLTYEGAKAFATADWFMTSPIGRLILFGFTWSLFHHLLGGLRHFIWDMGRGMEHPEREYLAQASLFGGIALTILVWVAAYMVR